MIPDFPTEKEKLTKAWTHYVEVRSYALLGFMEETPSYRHHEGNLWQLIRDDGSSSESEYQEISAAFIIDRKDVPGLTPEKIREKLDAIADEMAGQMSHHVIATIKRATDEAGNTIDAKGKKFSPEFFLDMLDRMQLSFDEDGTWQPPTLIVPPGFVETNKELISLFENNPDLRTRQKEIIDRQREEWRAREAYRKLVD